MSEIQIAGIMRSPTFSPNHIGNDAAIFNIVADQLRKRGCVVNVYSEEQFMATGVQERIIVNMCRERRSIEMLQAMEDDGRLVVNSGYGIENCIRERMTRIFLGTNVPFPKSIIVNTNESIIAELKRAGVERCWVKRGDFHTMHKEDVSYVRHAEEAQEVLQEYFLRGIKRAVISAHLEGDLVKFYGVGGTNYFYSFHPYESQVSYADEAVNGRPRNIAYDREALHKMCAEVADTLDLVVYGGECIVGADRSVTIIDFNDWPSFGPCRSEAAPVIARKILSMAKKML